MHNTYMANAVKNALIRAIERNKGSFAATIAQEKLRNGMSKYACEMAGIPAAPRKI